MGCDAADLLGPALLHHVNLDKLNKDYTQNYSRHAPQLPYYYAALADAGWIRRARRREQSLYNLGFSVSKSNGATARWVMDCGLNDYYTGPTHVELSRVERITDAFMFFEGGVERDGVSWYGQFPLHADVQHLFAMRQGSLRAAMCVMPQGFSGATHIAQQALNTITDHAYKETSANLFYENHIDNHLLLCAPTDYTNLAQAFTRTTTAVNADFGAVPEYSNRVTFTGAVLQYEAGERFVSLKEKWTAKVIPYLERIGNAKPHTTTDMYSLAGVTIWALRVLRHPMAVAAAVLDALRRDNNHITEEIKATCDAVRHLLDHPRRLPPLPSRYMHFHTDATPTKIAVVSWEQQPIDWSTFQPPRRGSVLQTLVDGLPGPTTTTANVYTRTTATTRINLNELLGIYEATKRAPPHTFLIIAVDSRVARRWATNGLAPTRIACRIILTIASTCRARGLRIAVTWVKSERNLADPFTRTDERTGTVDVTWHQPCKEAYICNWV